MRIYFVCQLEEIRANVWQPHIVTLQKTIGHFPAAWSTTDAIRAFKWAVGVAEVDATTQLPTIQADNAIILFDQSVLFNTFGSLNGAARNNINSFFDSVGVARPQLTEVLHDAWSRLSETVDFKTLDQLIAYLDFQIANYP